MDESRYDILFGGELLPGHEPGAVAENLGKLFKANPETVAKLMGGGVHALKRGADRDTALKYQAAMQRAGAKAILREVSGLAEGQSAASREAVPSEPAPQPSAITLAPVGGDLLAESERRRIEAVDVDTSHIKLASVFAAGPEREAPPPAPDVSHISVAAPGADLLPERAPEEAPPPPDTSALSIAEPGARLGPEDERPALPEIDLSAITLAPPGAALEELRPQRTPLNPDTSALGLEPLA
jgi:hypothetical protein